MTQKVLNEAQMREFVESEVRKALMKEGAQNSLLNECINEAIEENMSDEGVLNWLQNLIGGGAGQRGQAGGRGVSMEGIIGAVLAQFLAPVLKKLLAKIGIDPEGTIGKIIIGAATTGGGYALGNLVDKKWDPIGMDNLIGGRQPQSQPASE